MWHYYPYETYCVKLKDKGKYRQLPSTLLNSHDSFIDFSSNDYLNLSRRRELIEAAHEAGLKFGAGSTGSRLLSGNAPIFEALEAQIAKDKKTEATLLFNSGYQANISVLSALCDSSVLGKQALVFFDRLNHASLYQAIFLSNAALVRYRHNDMEHLEALLTQHQGDERPKFIVSETLYGMDGDVLPLRSLIQLAERFQAFVYLDEAHATGILGENGYGLSTTVPMKHIPYVIMGTFSKALGVCGAYVACPQNIKDYLINKCPGFIYSTAFSPMIAGAALYSWNHIRTLDLPRSELMEKASYIRKELHKLGLNTGPSTTHIIPIILGSEYVALKAYEFLQTQGIQVSAIRPPTVPPQSARLRIALTLKHQMTDLYQLLKALGRM